MDLTARREPTFHSGTHSISHDAGLAGAAHGAASPSRFTRFVSTLQIAGTLLGVPIALGSGYSLYRANFSLDTACQNLRGSIIAMLDKNVDAATRRILVRRDVSAFEQNCGAIDPDATAAFKTLLAVDKTATAAPKARAVAPTAEVVRQSEPKAERKVGAKAEPRAEAKNQAKPEPQLATAAKAPAVPTSSVAAADGAPPQADTGLSDARWLAAVRQALVEHAAESETSAKPAAAAVPKPQALGTPKPAEAPILQQAWVVPPPKPIASPAPTPPQTVPAAAVPQPDADHPVPPGAIPDAPLDIGKEERSTWVSKIPFVGPALDK